jgi:hypothetical protein
MRVVAPIPPNLHPLRGAALRYAKQIADGIGVLEFADINWEPPVILTTRQAIEIASQAAFGKDRRWLYERRKQDGESECGDATVCREYPDDWWSCLLKECWQVGFKCPPGTIYVRRSPLLYNLRRRIECGRGTVASEMVSILPPLKDCSEPLNLAPELRRW